VFLNTFPIALQFIPCPLPSGLLNDSFGDDVLPFCEKHFEKNILSQIPCFKKQIQQTFKKLKRFAKNCHNWLQHERLLMILYFHTLNSAKLG
jgi:hypothetical protein